MSAISLPRQEKPQRTPSNGLLVYPEAVGSFADTMCDEIAAPSLPPVPPQKCRICDQDTGLLRCAKCKSAFYCSSNHQHDDWARHKLECRRLAKQRKDSAASATNKLTSLWNMMSMATSDTEALNPQAECMGPNPNVASYGLLAENSSSRNHQLHAENPLIRRDPNRFAIDLGGASEKRYEDLCKIIIDDMNTYGLSVVDDFLGMDRGLQILNEVHKMYASDVFRDGQLVSNNITDKDQRTIRSDKITWVKGTEEGCSNIGYLINQIDAVVGLANTMHNNGLLGNYKIRERTKAMIACYPGSGAHYVMHVDNPNKDGRVITAIYYLNLNWDTKRSGGILRIFPEQGGSIADIEPKFDRLIFFWSDRRNPHEVQPAHRTRYAITVWYFDAIERERALSRCRQFSNAPNDCS